MIEPFKGLLFRANNDLQAAIDLFKINHKSMDVIMYHAQQCAEKTLKAFLVFNQYNYPKTHDLGVLINLCAEIEPEFYKLIEKATTLTPNATVFRYVDTLEEADELIEYL